ncbi:MAG: hypothetical protein RL885_15570 [Planctomycetota bacterium]
MAFCPRCECEYEDSVATCADCEVDLVASLDAEEARDAPSKGGTLELESEELAIIVAGWLSERGLPPEGTESTEEGTVLLTMAPETPGVAWQQARAELRLVQEVDAEGFPLYFRRFDPERDRPVEEPSILGDKSLAWLVKNKDESLAEIRKQLVSGQSRWRPVAFQVLSEIGVPGFELLSEVFESSVRESNPKALQGAVQGIAEYRKRRMATISLDESTVRGGLEHENPEIRLFTTQLVGRAGLNALAKDLLPRLEDEKEAIQEEADEALMHLFDVDFGFEASLEPEEKKRAIAAWHDHLGA